MVRVLTRPTIGIGLWVPLKADLPYLALPFRPAGAPGIPNTAFKDEAGRNGTLSGDITIGGANLAAQAAARRSGRRMPPLPQPRRGWPGAAALPDGLRLNLRLLDEQRFANGVVHLHYEKAG